MHGCIRLRDALKCISDSETILTVMVSRLLTGKLLSVQVSIERLVRRLHERLHAPARPTFDSCRDFMICSREYVLRALQA